MATKQIDDQQSSNAKKTKQAEKNTLQTTQSTDEAEQQVDFNPWPLMALTLLVIIGIGYFIYKFRTPPARKILRSHYNKLELSESKQQVGLFKRHQTDAAIVCNVADIQSLTILLNDSHLLQLNMENAASFNNDIETQLRVEFAAEQRHKMLPHKFRQIRMILKINGKDHAINLYLRQGNQRFTKSSYEKIIDELCDFCWHYAAEISTTPLAVRKHAQAQKQDDENNAKFYRHVERKPLKATSVTKTDSAQTDATHSETAKSQAIDTDEKPIVNNSELVSALEKLAQLKQQGHLDEDEFNQAKARILEKLG